MSEKRSYNLLCQSWIPVVWRDDVPEPKEPKVGIREALERAYEIKCISHTSPFIEFGLYRLLITIVLDSHIVAGKRPTIGKMRQMLASGQFDASLIGDYLGKYKQRFELWGGGERFLQRKPADGKKAEAVVRMFAAIPSGTNVAHWHHETEDEIGVAEETAAQFLNAVSPWNFKTKPGEARTLAGDPPMYALALGETLFETIILNLPRPSGRTSSKHEQEAGPVWRTPLEDLTKLPKSPTIAQGFTWPVRIIRLEEGGSVGRAINYASYKGPSEKAIKANQKKVSEGKPSDVLYGNTVAWRDPNAGTESDKDSVLHLKARPGVPIWRDAVPLFLVASQGEALKGEKRRSRPEIITNALRATDGRDLWVSVYGMRKKSGGGGDVKVEEWFRSVLTLPAEVARDERLSDKALGAFKTAQQVADALQVALRMLRPKMAAVPREKKNLRNTQRGETDALAGFWQRLEPALARTYLDDLAAGKADAKKSLRTVLRKETEETFRTAADPHRRDADGLFRIANASNYLERRLARLLPKEKNP